MARYLDDSAQFWVVRPSVTAQGVTGIETVLSGVYIEAHWNGTEGARVERFTALPRAPLTPAGTAGRRVTLRAPDGRTFGSITSKKIAVNLGKLSFYPCFNGIRVLTAHATQL